MRQSLRGLDEYGLQLLAVGAPWRVHHQEQRGGAGRHAALRQRLLGARLCALERLRERVLREQLDARLVDCSPLDLRRLLLSDARVAFCLRTFGLLRLLWRRAMRQNGTRKLR